MQRLFSHTRICMPERALLQRHEGLSRLAFRLPEACVSHLCQEKIFFQSLMNRIRGRLFLLSCHFCSFVLSLLVVPMESPWITPFFLPLFLAFSKPKLSVRASAQPSTFSLPQPGNIFHCSRQTLKNMTTPTLCISHSGCLGGVRQRPEAGSGGKGQPHPAGAQLGSQE